MTLMRDRTFVVTGANSGIGREAARQIAQRGATLVLTARDPQRGALALEDIRSSSGNPNVSLQIFDLASLKDVRRGAANLLNECPRIDALINNAGVHDLRGGTTQDGIQKVMATNFVGPFLLTGLLMERLLETSSRHGDARVVNVSSSGHKVAWRFDPETPIPRPWPPNREPYTESKLANILHAMELARRYGAQGLQAHAVDPGYVASNIGRKEHWPGAWQLAFTLSKPWQISAQKGAAPLVTVATEDFDGANGGYWTSKGRETPRLPTDAARAAQKLWDFTEGLIAETAPPA